MQAEQLTGERKADQPDLEGDGPRHRGDERAVAAGAGRRSDTRSERRFIRNILSGNVAEVSVMVLAPLLGMPMSARLSADASSTPSPVIATTCPWRWSACTMRPCSRPIAAAVSPRSGSLPIPRATSAAARLCGEAGVVRARRPRAPPAGLRHAR